MLALFLLACSAPPQAPRELDDLMGFLFGHAMDEDERALADGGAKLSAWMDARLAETLDGYAVNVLDPETLRALDGQPREAEGLVGAAVGHTSPHGPLPLTATVITVSPTERSPEQVLAYRREEDLRARECFLDERCERHTYTTWSTDALPLGLEVSSVNEVQYRWFTTPEGERALIQRNWMVQAAEVNRDWLEVLAQYYVWVSLPHEGGSRNMYATWALTRLTGNDVPESLALSLAVGTMQDSALALDGWIEAHPPSW